MSGIDPDLIEARDIASRLCDNKDAEDMCLSGAWDDELIVLSALNGLKVGRDITGADRARSTLRQCHHYWLVAAKEALQGDMGKLRKHVALSSDDPEAWTIAAGDQADTPDEVPLCAKCVHFIPRHGFEADLCQRPLSSARSPVSGELTQLAETPAWKERRDGKRWSGHVRCGLSGQFFEQAKDPK